MRLLVWTCLLVILSGCVRSYTQIITCGGAPKKETLKAIIHELPPEYEVTFSVLPIAFAVSEENVFNFVYDNGNLGYINIPGVWLHGNKLHVSADIGNPRQSFVANSQRLEEYTWVDVKISSKKHGSMYWYSVIVNGKTVRGTDIPNLQSYKNVKVYVKPFKDVVYLRDLRIKVPGSKGAIIDTRVPTLTVFCQDPIKKGNLVATITSIPPAYEITFLVKPTAFTDGYSNVFHFTTGGNNGQLGYRIPGVWFNRDKLHICGSVENNPNFCVDSQRLLKDKWIHVTISSKKHGSMYWYAVIVDGKTVKGTDNPSFQTYRNVKVYASDPWYPPFKGVLSNLEIKVGA